MKRSESPARAGAKWMALAAIACVLLCPGCSQFQGQWRAAGKRPTPTNEMTGRWEGTWRSSTTGHQGRLRCVVTRPAEDSHEAWFQAKYKGILSFDYKVPLEVRRQGDLFRFQGEADLGKAAGGAYRYDGLASDTNFFSSYKSEKDIGWFQMGRPR